MRPAGPLGSLGFVSDFFHARVESGHGGGKRGSLRLGARGRRGKILQGVELVLGHGFKPLSVIGS